MDIIYWSIGICLTFFMIILAFLVSTTTYVWLMAGMIIFFLACPLVVRLSNRSINSNDNVK